MNKEIWKPLLEYHSEHTEYFVSNRGKIYSFRKKKNYTQIKELKIKKVRDGYLYFRVTKNYKQKLLSAHRTVAKLFIPNPEKKPQVNHVDLNKHNNCVSNLEWVTPKENLKHALKNKGEWRKGGKGGKGGTSYEIPNFVSGMTSTKEGKAEYMKVYSKIWYARKKTPSTA